MTTWEIFCYPLEKNRKDAEFFDEVTCDKETVTTLTRALYEAHQKDNLWFFHKEKAGQELVEHNWEQTGKFMEDEVVPEPVGDPTWDGLKAMLFDTSAVLSVPTAGTAI